jgi:hypothetical protein
MVGRKKKSKSSSICSAMLISTYIIRLYRFQKNRPRSLLGVVEKVGEKGKKAFANYDELWGILNASPSGKSHERPRKRGGNILWTLP